MARAYALSDEMADQLVKMLAWWNAQPTGMKPVPRPTPNKTTTNIQRLRITNDTPTTESSIDYYEADVIRWSVVLGDWEVVADASPVQVFDPAGVGFAVDDEVDARMVDSGDIGGDTFPVFEKITGGSATTCDLPESAEELATNSDAGLEGWTHDEMLQIQLSEECCYLPFVDRFCSDDGTHMQCKRFTAYFSTKVKLASGPTEDNCPPPDWQNGTNPTCSGMTDF